VLGILQRAVYLWLGNYRRQLVLSLLFEVVLLTLAMPIGDADSAMVDVLGVEVLGKVSVVLAVSVKRVQHIQSSAQVCKTAM
jgi:hypothetical protein